MCEYCEIDESCKPGIRANALGKRDEYLPCEPFPYSCSRLERHVGGNQWEGWTITLMEWGGLMPEEAYQVWFCPIYGRELD